MFILYGSRVILNLRVIGLLQIQSDVPLSAKVPKKCSGNLGLPATCELWLARAATIRIRVHHEGRRDQNLFVDDQSLRIRYR